VPAIGSHGGHTFFFLLECVPAIGSHGGQVHVFEIFFVLFLLLLLYCLECVPAIGIHGGHVHAVVTGACPKRLANSKVWFS
jgi:hypothetical protein